VCLLLEPFAMAALFADVGKNADDLLKNVFPTAETHFETEVNSKTVAGSKVQVIVARDKEAVKATFKPTYPVSVGDVQGELKLQLSTDNKSKVDTSFNVNAISGLKLKLGVNDAGLNGGFDYASGNLSSNLKVDYPQRKAPSVEAASVFVHGHYALGGKVFFDLSEHSPVVEAKIERVSEDASTTIHATRKEAELQLALSYFIRVNASRSLASKITFVPGASSFADHVNVSLATSNQVNDSTLVKARYTSSDNSIAFGLAHTLNSNLSVELGTAFPASFGAGSVYNVKLIYN